MLTGAIALTVDKVATYLWIWDQSLLTVEINTITRVLRQDICMSCNGRRHDYPRSIVADHYLLDTSYGYIVKPVARAIKIKHAGFNLVSC